MRLFFALMCIPAMAFAQVEQDPPNSDYTPAFSNQTRAPALPDTPLQIEEGLATWLDAPWGFARMPNGQFLVTEQAGQMYLMNADYSQANEVTGLPDVVKLGQGGLLDVAVSPNFANDRAVFWTYSKPLRGGAATAAARGTLSADGTNLTDVQDIFVMNLTSDAGQHFGSRIIPTADGKVWITTGDRGQPNNAQDLNSTAGAVMRVNADGSIPADNPFVGGRGNQAIWSYGHRNVQGAAIGPDGAIWTMEHGPRGGDELNRPEAGKNYGWPVITYGLEYSGQPVGGPEQVRTGMEQPVYYWDPVIAPGDFIFYNGPYADWQGDALIASLTGQGISRLKIENGQVIGEEKFYFWKGGIRDIEALPDGSILALMRDGAIVRLMPG